MARQRRDLGGGKRPEVKETDRLDVRTEAKRRRSEAEGRFADVIEHVHFTNESGRAAYEKGLRGLGESPEEIRKIVTDLELSRPNDHSLQWTLYYIAADLELPELAPMLVDAAVRDLPDITDTTACETVDDDKILVATMAVEGVARLVRKDKEVAVRALMEIVERQPHVAVRIAAVQAILAIEPDMERDVADLLSEDQLYMLEARKINVERLSAIPERIVPKRSAVRSPRLESDMDAPRITEKGE